MPAVLLAALRSVSWRASLLALTLGLCSCVAPTYRQMRSERDLPRFHDASAQFYAATDDLLLAPTIDEDNADERPIHVAVHRMGSAHSDAGDRAIVFLHGVLADSSAWRFVAGSLLDSHRLWLVDYPGLGASDRVRPATLGEGAYSPSWLAERVAQALDQAIAESAARSGSAPTSITLVGHSLGGAVALHMLSDAHIRSEHDNLLSRIDGAVLIAPLDANLPVVNPATLQAARVSSFEVWLATLTATARERIAQGVAQNAADRALALREEVDAKYSILTRADTRLATQAMLMHAVPNKGAKPDWPAIEAITQSYARVQTPTLILWGQRDESLPVAMGYKLASQLPRASLRIFPDAKHSPHLDYPVVVAALIREFIGAPSTDARSRGLDVNGSLPTPAVRLIEPTIIEAWPEQRSSSEPAHGRSDPPTL